jgi:hypothetical protein
VARLLIEGRAVEVGGYTVRFFPSYRQVARQLGCAPSTVMRWAARNQIAAARDVRLAADRIDARPVLPSSLQAITEEMLAMVRAQCRTSGRALSLRHVATILRLIGVLVGALEGNASLVRELERLRDSLLRHARRAR